MELEEFISGYCRVLDASRMVTVECSADAVYADCCYGNCPYEPQCQIAQKIRELTKI